MKNDHEEPVPLEFGFHDAIHNSAFAWKPTWSQTKGNDDMSQPDLNKLAEYYSEILKEIGADVDSEGLKETPLRAAKALVEILRKYGVM